MENADIDDIEKAESNASYLKWPGPHTVRFDAGPEIRRRHWMGSTPEDCAGPGCAICASVQKPDDPRKLKVSFLYEVSVWPGGEEDGAVMDLSQAAQKSLTPVMRALKDVHGEGWREVFAEQWFRAERKGSGKGTTYTFLQVDPGAKAKKPAKGKAEDEIPF